LTILSSVTDKLVCLRTQWAYLEAHVDVNLSSNDDTITVPKPDVLADQKTLAGDEARDDGVTSAEPIALVPISSAVLEPSKSSAADQVLAIVPPSSKRGRKRPPPATKRSKTISSAD
jgi:hypothetical protein